MSIIRQSLCTVIVCYICLTLGLMYAWPSSTLKIFSSVNTTLDRPMTETELSLLGSLSSISAMIATPISGFLLDRLGRKYTCILFSLPQVIAWAIVSVVHKVEAILAAAFIAGFGGCVLLIVPVYVSEFCEESIRGRLTSGSIIFYGIGTLVSYLLGGLLEYDMMNYIFLSLSVLATALMTIVADSPIYLMKKGQETNAAKAIAFYRATKVDSKVVTEEMITIRRCLNAEMDDDTPEEKKLKVEGKQEEKLSFWKLMKKSRSSRLALLLGVTLYSSSIFQGLVAVQVYAEPLFSEAVPNMSATVSSVLFAVVVVGSGFVAAYFVDVAGRRPLMIYPSLFAGVCCVILGTQIQFHWGPHWMTAVIIYLYCIAYTFGAGTVPYVIVAEVFLPEVRSIASMLTIEWAWICNFIVLFIFNPLVTALGLGGIFYIFAAVCFLSAIYSYFYMPETSGLTVDVIQGLFAKKSKGKPVV
ncbi:facilitated trehalose transporter Tret1-like [Epargyreus clarus]|uniref:facilitated trehalose transporter Tret1-like n=1 Tax=Epargyreus clarus TaxID=520877 RepID=UPI003C2F5B3D